MKLDNIISAVAITVMVIGLFIFIWLIRKEIKSEALMPLGKMRSFILET
jgi:hypothetical protein